MQVLMTELHTTKENIFANLTAASQKKNGLHQRIEGHIVSLFNVLEKYIEG